jgi:hypothetical protein
VCWDGPLAWCSVRQWRAPLPFFGACTQGTLPHTQPFTPCPHSTRPHLCGLACGRRPSPPYRAFSVIHVFSDAHCGWVPVRGPWHCPMVWWGSTAGVGPLRFPPLLGFCSVVVKTPLCLPSLLWAPIPYPPLSSAPHLRVCVQRQQPRPPRLRRQSSWGRTTRPWPCTPRYGCAQTTPAPHPAVVTSQAHQAPTQSVALGRSVALEFRLWLSGGLWWWWCVEGEAVGPIDHVLLR